MARNEISRLTITIDIDKATGKIVSLNQKLGDTERKVRSADQSIRSMGNTMQNTGNQAGRMGDQAAAGAVGFQTMAQGMLNVTTSAAQTYTSFTNLATAEHKVAAAHVAVARGQDLLNAKKLRYDELVAKGLGNTQKAINLLKEQQTAEADLIVKKEKLRIEQSKMNDVYILFGVNLLNVAVSLGTTIAAMKASRAAAAVVNAQMAQNNATMRHGTMITKFHTVATWSNLRAKWQETSAIRASNAVLPVNWRLLNTNTKALGFTTTATKLLTGAVRGLNLAFGPVGIAMMGISLAIGFLMPELEKLGRGVFGMSDALDETTDKLNETTGAMEGLDTTMQNTAETMKNKIPDGTKVMVAGLQNAIDNAETFQQKLRLIRTQAELLKSSGVLTDFR